ncbi:unnamed protein product (macronuclear) [Paramecium tetraurelia]|uniref:BTB domain-containing protein n=1 Tax=Paramecium tetraurelia TaxID=5888 RepID=A0CPD7_PARTE|nr:uncharacterized protein GSPATT00009045001 [Paramecium tetraurelia]CAK72654.1 unnamed protein product [Paramecium tetraurelia]|eukprot:XP_001440051.1 hypothetical protein (macronuclear) [Paramecium tetraurelia strain d4-2]
METDVIDLGKQVFGNHSLLVQQCFVDLKLKQANNATLIFYQKFPPLQFQIIDGFILQEIKLDRIYHQFLKPSQHVIPYTTDFYLENQDPKILFQLFLSFLYTGKLVYKVREHYIPLLKLAIYFQCDILIQSLLNQPKQSGIIRNFFLKFLCDIFNDETYTQTLLSKQKAQKFLERMIIDNSPIIIKHTELHNHNKKDAQEQIQKSFKQVSPQLFNVFADTLKANPEKIIYLSALLFFINKYENPWIKTIEGIYLGKMYDLIDEEFYDQHEEWLTERCKLVFRIQIDKSLNQPFHMNHSVACDLVNKSFVASCSHHMCLNCFYEYLRHRSQFKYQSLEIPQKIRCLTRHLNKDICDCFYQDQDYLQLKQYGINEILNLYLQEKI